MSNKEIVESLNAINDRLESINENFIYRQSRPLIRINPKHGVIFLIVLELAVQCFILYKLL